MGPILEMPLEIGNSFSSFDKKNDQATVRVEGPDRFQHHRMLSCLRQVRRQAAVAAAAPLPLPGDFAAIPAARP